MPMRVPMFQEIKDEIVALYQALTSTCSPETLLRATEHYLRLRNLQKAMVSPEVEDGLARVNTALLKAVGAAGAVGRASGAGAGQGGATGPAVPEVTTHTATGSAPPGSVLSHEQVMAASDEQDRRNAQTDAALDAADSLCDAAARRTVMAEQEQTPPPAHPSPSTEAPKKRGRPKKGVVVVDGVETPAAGLLLTHQTPSSADGVVPAGYTEANIQTHPLFKEMVQNWKGAELVAEYKKVTGKEPGPVTTSGHMAAAILLGRDKAKSQRSTPVVVETDEEGEPVQGLLPLERADPKASHAETASALQADVDRLDAEAKASNAPKNYPEDPMPEHWDAHKVWFGDLKVWECDVCKSDQLVMCIPSHPLEGTLYCATRCLKCKDSQRFPITEADAQEVRKVAKVLISRMPGRPTPQPQAAPAPQPQAPKKKSPRAQATQAANPQAPAAQAAPAHVAPAPPSKLVSIADPNQLLAEVLGGAPSPPVNVEACAVELEQQIKLWPAEKRIAEYEKFTGKAAPKTGLKEFADTEAVKVVARYYAGASAAL